MSECWVLFHRNDVDDNEVSTPLNIHFRGAFESEEKAKASLKDLEPTDWWDQGVTHEGQSLWSGHDHYWLVRLW